MPVSGSKGVSGRPGVSTIYGGTGVSGLPGVSSAPLPGGQQNYVAEDGVTLYVAEDGATEYVTEA